MGKYNKPEIKIPRDRYRKRLTKRQKIFCKYYIELGNATEAAKKAGYSAKCAYVIGPRLIDNPIITEEINKDRALFEKQLLEEHNITIKDIRAKLVAIGFSSLKHYAKWDKHGLELLDSDLSSCVGLKTIKTKRITRFIKKTNEEIEEVTTAISLEDRVKALIALGEHAGMFTEQRDDGSESDRKIIEDRVLELTKEFEKTGDIK